MLRFNREGPKRQRRGQNKSKGLLLFPWLETRNSFLDSFSRSKFKPNQIQIWKKSTRIRLGQRVGSSDLALQNGKVMNFKALGHPNESMSRLPRRFVGDSSMEDPGFSLRPSIYYRPSSPNDLDRLEQIHRDIFPIKYESEFYQSVVNGVGIVSWAAVDRSHPDGHSDELIGFVTAKFVLVKESEIDDLICYDSSKGEETMIYILTLGVVETYRNHGIAMSLISEVIRYASGLSVCRGVYLHVIEHNNPAIRLYRRLMFRCVRRLNGFYLIKRQHFDAFLFVYFINGSRSPCSPLEVAMFVVSYVKSGMKSVASKLTRIEAKGLKWLICKDDDCVLSAYEFI